MSFFKAPAWAQPQTAKTDDDDHEEDLFSHKGSFMSMFKDQTERQKKEKEREERRKAKKQEKRKSAEKRDSEEATVKSEFKKRRITSEESSKLLAKAGIGASLISLSDDDDDEKPAEQALPVRRSPRNNRSKNVSSPGRGKSRLIAPIDSGNESEDDVQVTVVKAPARPAPESEEDFDSDPEIAEMQRQAREKARAKQWETTKTSSSGSKGTPDASSSTRSAPDPAVKILVSSDLPGTKPLILCRKISQRLKEVREMWCTKQGFSEHETSKIFFVHRGRQYWDSTTVRRLGLEVDADGRIYRTDDPTKEGVDQVHVEAVTSELFEEIKAEKARKDKASVAVYDEEEEQQADDEAAERPNDDIRLTVKAKGKPDWKVIVKPVSISWLPCVENLG